ncbi:MAG: glutamine ABC transporter substrate-binding protein, partial [Muribaculaceae bacterium]|nr:glutamine ABC transporter substrate-binding protein [Muribaculaceae bacterium]
NSRLKKYPELDASLEISFNQFQSWVVAPRDSILRDSLNSFIQRFQQTEYYNNLINKYFH